MIVIPETDNPLQEMIDFLTDNHDMMHLVMLAIIRIQNEQIDKFRILEKPNYSKENCNFETADSKNIDKKT